MARLWSCGYELQTVANGGEWDTSTNTPAIDTTTKRSGSASLRCNTTGTGKYTQHRVIASTSRMFARVYIYVASLPSGTTELLDFIGNTGTYLVGIRMTSGGALQLYDFVNAAQRGSNSSALSTSTWYMVELELNGGGSSCAAKLDGTQFASGTGPSASDISDVAIGVLNSVTADIYFDDVAVNDTTGSAQTSYPGSGQIIHVRPGGAGDNTGWTASTGSNWQCVDEVTPAAADNVSQSTLDVIDDYTVTSSGLTGSDTVTLVAVGNTSENNIANATMAFQLRIKKTTGGTVSASGNIIPNNTSMQLHKGSTPRVHQLTAYTDPDGGAWTSTTLGTMQIGVKATVDSTRTMRVDALWALIEYVAGVGGATFMEWPVINGKKFWGPRYG